MAEVEGTLDPAFQPVGEALAEQIDVRGGGAAVCVYHRGRPVADLWGGVRDASRTPWRADDLTMSFSTTKGVAAAALHTCVDRGLLDYDDPVAEYWPEFAQNGKEGITVRHVLCHEAGMHDVLSLIDEPEQLLDWDAMVDALARARPAFEPGTVNAYHAVTFGYLVGEIVRRATGDTISEIVQRDLATPLGLDGCYIGLPGSELRRVVELSGHDEVLNGDSRGHQRLSALVDAAAAAGIEFDPQLIREALGGPAVTALLNRPELLEASVPALNGCFTARSLARLYAALGAGGTLDGRRIISAETMARATETQNDRRDLVIVMRQFWRLGYHRVWTAAGTLRDGFGHNGYGGSGAWADPTRALSCAMTLNALSGALVDDTRFATVGAAAVQAADAISAA
ncbi:MAG: serine hydrolase domain-containing protein [Acidimicrobiia bacterium]